MARPLAVRRPDGLSILSSTVLSFFVGTRGDDNGSSGTFILEVLQQW